MTKKKKTPNSPPKKVKKYILSGDIRHPGWIVVIADSLDEAVKKAEEGEFKIHEESDQCLVFDWDGNQDPEVIEEDP